MAEDRRIYLPAGNMSRAGCASRADRIWAALPDASTVAVRVAAVLALLGFGGMMGGALFPALDHAVTGDIGQKAGWSVQFALMLVVMLGAARRLRPLGRPVLATARRREPVRWSVCDEYR